MRNIVIFASGSGTNAENIARYFHSGKIANVSLILTNNKNAGVIERSQKLKIPVMVFNRSLFYESDHVFRTLIDKKTDLIVLAGFLWMVPERILKAFENRILNIHPALLPKYGGKGMYGQHVHKAVIENGEMKSGITIHYVNEKYDEGKIIFQKELDVLPMDTPESLASKIHELEYRHYPEIIEKVVKSLS